MPSMIRPRSSLATALVFVAIVACSLGLARVPTVWVVLDAPRSGEIAAWLRYIWLCGGLAMAVLLVRSTARRLYAYGWVLVGSLAIPLPFPHHDLAITPDLARSFNVASILAAFAFFVAGLIGSTIGSEVR